MDAHEVSAEARGAISAKRVFGKPYEHKGTVVIPAAKVRGGVDRRLLGFGLQFGMRSQPLGAFVIRGDKVQWKPVIDVNTLLLRAQAIGAVALLLALRYHRR